MTHRGPDDEGYHCRGEIGLGHRRLSIIDLNTGQQPIFNEDGSKAIVFNGEIYNFPELRKELETKGHIFKTRTDTEVILHGFEQWGTNCVNRLRGMFAFAVWDEKKKSLFLARDRLGIKPLYYTAENSMFLFGSELKAILASKMVKKQLNIQALSDYFSLGYVPAPKSIFQNVFKLPAGYFMEVTAGHVSLQQYWDISFHADDSRSMTDLCDRLVHELKEAVRIRLISDVPLGAFLSGGIDSSGVVALMASLTRDPLITNSIGFTKREFSELDEARQTAALFNTKHHEYTVSPDAVDIIDRLAWFYDEPFADASSIPTYYVSKMTRENVTVALSGDGGDENFLGYPRYKMDLLENQVRTMLPEWFRRYGIAPLARVYPKADWAPRVFRGKTFLSNVAADGAQAHFNSISLLWPELKASLFHPDVQKALAGYDSVDVFRQHYQTFTQNSDGDFLSGIQYVDMKTYLVDDILTKVDRASMATSLEVRVPVLDHKFMEFAATIPSHMKLHNGNQKYIFKKALSKILPHEVLNREKKGFSVPLNHWLKTDLKAMGEALLFGGGRGTELFDTRFVKSMWDQHLSGKRDFTEGIWMLICFHLWMDKYL